MQSHAPLCLYISNCVLSVASLSIAWLRLARAVCSPLLTCFEWKAGPPSSLPSSALVLQPAVCSEQKRFLNVTVETARTAR
jgi:hypothetical protein